MTVDGTVPEKFGFEINEAIQLGPKPAIEELAIPQARDEDMEEELGGMEIPGGCLLYTSPSPRDGLLSRMPSSA